MAQNQNIFEHTLKLINETADKAQTGLSKEIVPIYTTLMDKIGAFKDVPENFFGHIQPQIDAQVKAIDKRTEDAADSIMSACERMMAKLSKLPAELQTDFTNEINAIFEACSFQDLISQHAKEIKLRAGELADDMNDFNSVIQGTSDGDPRERTRDKNRRENDHLMNGPTTDISEEASSSTGT